MQCSKLVLINPQFEEAWTFREQLAAVRIGDDKTGQYGLIDKQGHFVVNPQYGFIAEFSEGLSMAYIRRKKSGRTWMVDTVVWASRSARKNCRNMWQAWGMKALLPA
jgi:WG containing repeat